jgi:hypothetical protein
MKLGENGIMEVIKKEATINVEEHFNKEAKSYVSNYKSTNVWYR